MTKPKLEQGADYERGFVDGAQHQMQSSVDRAVNAMTQPTYYIPSKDQRTWVGLTDDEIWEAYMESPMELDCSTQHLMTLVERVVAEEREACANTAGLALLGADKALSDRVLKAIRARGQA